LPSWIAVGLSNDPIRGDREVSVQFDVVVGDEVDRGVLKNRSLVYELFGRVQSTLAVEEPMIRGHVQIFKWFVWPERVFSDADWRGGRNCFPTVFANIPDLHGDVVPDDMSIFDDGAMSHDQIPDSEVFNGDIPIVC
jgi:hypothetical protein